MGIGKRLKEARERLGLTQEELGKRIGVTGSAITNYEKETSHPKEPVMYALMEALNVEPNFLFQDCVNTLKGRENIKPQEMVHIKKYRVLDEHGKEVVDGALELEYKRVTAAKEAEAATGRWRAGKQAQLTKFLRQKRRPLPAPPREEKVVRFTVPQYQEPMSAGCGEVIGTAYEENIELVKEPPRGTSFIAKIKGDSMEPTYHDGEWVFIHAQTEIQPGQVGVFYMDGKEWIKELGNGELISHNPANPPRPMTEDIRCQGLVLGVCDASYFA